MTEEQKAHVFIPRKKTHIDPLEHIRRGFNGLCINILHSVTLDVPGQTSLDGQEGILISVSSEGKHFLNGSEPSLTESAQELVDIFYHQSLGEVNKSAVAVLYSSAVAKNSCFGDATGVWVPQIFVAT